MDFKAGLYDASGSGITGSTDLVIKIKRDADDYFYDFDDSSFKASGWVSISSQLSEPDAVNMPGEYEAAVDVSTWDDGVYTAYIQYSGSPAWTDAVEFRVYDGKESVALAEELGTQAKADVNAEADTALSSYDPPTKAEMDTALGNLNDPTAAAIATAVMAKVVDGSLNVTEILKILLAVLAGDMIKSENTYTYAEQDGTVKVTEVVSIDAVERTIA